VVKAISRSSQLSSPFNDPLILEQKFLKEVHVWWKLDHTNVHPLLGITTEFDLTVSIVSPWMENGNAHNHVQNKTVDPRPLVSARIRSYSCLNTTMQIEGIAEGLHYLHTHTPHPIFHGDLKGVGLDIFQEMTTV